VPIISSKGQRSRSPDVKRNTENWCDVYLSAADQAQTGQAQTANYAETIVRPNLLSAPESHITSALGSDMLSFITKSCNYS